MRIHLYRPSKPGNDPLTQSTRTEFQMGSVEDYDIYESGGDVYVFRQSDVLRDTSKGREAVPEIFGVKFTAHGSCYFKGDAALRVAQDFYKKWPREPSE